VGLNLFVIQAIAKARLSAVIKGAWPFIIIMLASIALIYFVPDIAIYIPFKF
jgi:C4-dicarboxylate transporter DctM subunit